MRLSARCLDGGARRLLHFASSFCLQLLDLHAGTRPGFASCQILTGSHSQEPTSRGEFGRKTYFLMGPHPRSRLRVHGIQLSDLPRSLHASRHWHARHLRCACSWPWSLRAGGIQPNAAVCSESSQHQHARRIRRASGIQNLNDSTRGNEWTEHAPAAEPNKPAMSVVSNQQCVDHPRKAQYSIAIACGFIVLSSKQRSMPITVCLRLCEGDLVLSRVYFTVRFPESSHRLASVGSFWLVRMAL